MSDLTPTVIIAFCSLLCSVCAVIFNFKGNKRAEQNETKSETATSATVLVEIGYIKSGIDEIKDKNKDFEKRSIETLQRLAECEVEVAEVKDRVATVEKRMNYLHKP